MDRYYVPCSDQRDFDCRIDDLAEMRAMQRAFKRANRCEVCGAKPTTTKRHDGAIVVSCRACVGKRPSPQQQTVNRTLAAARARLEALETRRRAL
jgi:hypothetical protein